MDKTRNVETGLAEKVRQGAQEALSGALSDDAFKPLRLSVGAHRQRKGDGYMVRIRVPGGRLSAREWSDLAGIAERRAVRAHLTLRQDIQLYGVQLQELADTVAELSSRGLCTYASGGSTVRNVTSAVLGDREPGSVFDPYPYAAALSARLSRHPLFNALPRKFKIGFAGAGREAAQGWLNDLGFIPRVRDGLRGFRLVAGGGLGASPQNGFEIEPFIPAGMAGAYAEAALEYFAETAPPGKPAINRFKFILRAQGAEAVRAAIRARLENKPEDAEFPEPGVPGGSSVWIEAAQGDFSLGQLSGIGRALKEAGADQVRISFDQRLLVPDLSAEALPRLLAAARGLGLEASERPAAVRLVVCAGPDTCNRGLVNSKALGRELRDLKLPVDLHLSGCQNGCSQHLIAPLSLQGTVRSTPQGRQPCYVLRAAAKVDAGGIAFGPPLLTLPARRVRRGLERLSADWLEERTEGTDFGEWLAAQSETALTERLAEQLKDGRDAWLDCGSDEVFEVALGGSECH
jgi:sulfite reductase (ferredoxin)